ncbi:MULTISPECIES: SPOR domain-containing protein [Flavobacterium]|uniref:SPOR domain-containing protein n=1 Tax=Flavobacterium jumunjinense TaxID=998845 RepID=A0ABV5GTK5_9FLAO|nr:MULTISPECIES: SPOR domain-containing protein [Flavobacterium]
MKLDKYISDLLYRYQCVTVPGFGAFVTENQSAQISGSACTFIPPRKVIFFNMNIKNNDGLLANHISLQEKVTYDEALEKINAQVSVWMDSIYKKDRIVLNNIGDIFINSDQKWIFEPSTSVNYLVSSFGLNSFVIPEMKREALKEQVEVLEAKVPIIFTAERKKSYSFLKYAAAITLFFGAGTAAYKIQHDQQVEIDTFLVKKEVQRKVQSTIQEATFFIDSPINPVELIVKEEKASPFHLIAGAFRSEANAKKALKILKEEGYPAHILKQNSNGLIPVAYSSFKTEEEAEVEKNRLLKVDKADCWILIE